MKRIISVFLALVMIAATMAMSAGAAGTLVHSDDFTMGFAAKNWMTNAGTAFKWHEDGYIYGFGNARVLESRYGARDNKIFDQFYTSFDVRICDYDEMFLEANHDIHVIGFWYRDRYESGSLGAQYQYFVEIETGRAYIVKSHEFSYYDEHGILQKHVLNGVQICEGQVEDEIPMGENAPFVNIGMRVTEGRIEGYFNEKLICFAEYDPDGEKLGDVYLNGVDPTVGSEKSPILFWSGLDGGGTLYVQLDNFEVWSANYDFASYGDVDSNGKINLGDVSAMLKKIAKYDVTIDEAAADVDVNGKLNLADVSMVLKYIAKWDVVLGQAK